MIKKVTILPFLKPKDLPMSQRVEIRQANEECAEQVKQNRSRIEEGLEDGMGLLAEKGMKNQILKCLRRVVSGLRISRKELKSSVGCEVLGEDMTWAEIQALLSGLLAIVYERGVNKEAKEARASSKPLDELLMTGCSAGIQNAEVAEVACRELGRLAKADYQSMVRLINMGLQIERAAKD